MADWLFTFPQFFNNVFRLFNRYSPDTDIRSKLFFLIPIGKNKILMSYFEIYAAHTSGEASVNFNDPAYSEALPCVEYF